MTGRGKKPSQAHAKSRDGFFLDRQGEKAIRALWSQRKPAKSEQHIIFLLPVEEKGSIPAKSVRPKGLFPLPQGKNINREWLTPLEIVLFPLPERDKWIP